MTFQSTSWKYLLFLSTQRPPLRLSDYANDLLIGVLVSSLLFSNPFSIQGAWVMLSGPKSITLLFCPNSWVAALCIRMYSENPQGKALYGWTSFSFPALSLWVFSLFPTHWSSRASWVPQMRPVFPASGLLHCPFLRGMLWPHSSPG